MPAHDQFWTATCSSTIICYTQQHPALWKPIQAWVRSMKDQSQCLQVLHCPQTRVSAKGTPSELYFAAQQLQAQKGRPRGDLPALIQQFGLEQGILNQPWPELSVSLPG